jgi:hypothetical protein
MSAVEEPRDIYEWRDDAARSLSPPDVTVRRLEEEVRTLVRGRRPGKTAEPATSSPVTDILAIGVTSIADIEKLMGELLIARDYLQSEGERVRQANASYVHLAQTASASVKTIAESLGKWRNIETTTSEAAASLPRAPTLAPVQDDELQHEPTISNAG